MNILLTADPSNVIEKALESDNIFLIIFIVLSISVLPTILAFITERKRISKFNEILLKQDLILNEQRDVNKSMLSFLDKNSMTDELNPIQLVGIFEEFLSSGKIKIIEEVKRTLQMNNLKNQKLINVKVKNYCDEILEDTFEKMFWFEYKGIKIGSLISKEWYNVVSTNVLDFIYDNKYAITNEGDKLNYYDISILNRNLDLSMRMFINMFHKRVTTLKSEIEKKISAYEES